MNSASQPLVHVRASVEHYVEKLGFECAPEGIVDGAGDEGAIYGIVRRAGVEIHLGVRRRGHDIDPGRPPNAQGVYLFVEDAKALHEELQGRGADIASEPRRQPWGMLDFTVRDPDGYILGFGSQS